MDFPYHAYLLHLPVLSILLFSAVFCFGYALGYSIKKTGGDTIIRVAFIFEDEDEDSYDAEHYDPGWEETLLYEEG